MNRHDPSLAVAHKVAIDARRKEPPMFDRRVAIEMKVHDLETVVADLMAAPHQYLVENEDRLVSAMRGLQFLCSDILETKLKQLRAGK